MRHTIPYIILYIFQFIGYDYMAYMDYMGLDVCRLRKAVRLNHFHCVGKIFF